MAEKPSPDWERIETDYRLGLKTLREIAGEHDLTEGAIRKRAKRDDWVRDLAAKVRAKADELVRREAVRTEVRRSGARTESERETVDVEAKVQARIRLAQRGDIGRGRALVNKLLLELEQQTDGLATYEQLVEALASPDGEDDDASKDRRKRLWEQWQKAISLPGRTDTMKKLADTLRILIDKEREAYGMSSDDLDADKGAITVVINTYREAAPA